MVILHYFSIIIELLVALLGLKIYFGKKKGYGLAFFITFGIYVFYDLARLLAWSISTNILYFSFFIASVSALFAVWSVSKK